MRRYLMDEKDTIAVGVCLGKHLEPPMVIALRGDLGAGKTTLTKGIAAALGVQDMVTSPTFSLLNIYYGRVEVAHIDAYRLRTSDEGYDAGLEEYLPGMGITIIEWPESVSPLLPREFLEVRLSYLDNRPGREIVVISHGGIYDRVEKELEVNCS